MPSRRHKPPTRTQIIQITEEDIEQGVPYSVDLCAFARAISRYLNIRALVQDGNIYAYHHEKRARLVCKLSRDLYRKIETYHDSWKLKPCKFKLRYEGWRLAGYTEADGVNIKAWK